MTKERIKTSRGVPGRVIRLTFKDGIGGRKIDGIIETLSPSLKTGYNWNDVKANVEFSDRVYPLVRLAIELGGLNGSGYASSSDFAYSLPAYFEDIVYSSSIGRT